MPSQHSASWQLPEVLLVGTHAQDPALQMPLQQSEESAQDVPVVAQHLPERHS
jgi:hypothetical protein